MPASAHAPVSLDAPTATSSRVRSWSSTSRRSNRRGGDDTTYLNDWNKRVAGESLRPTSKVQHFGLDKHVEEVLRGHEVGSRSGVLQCQLLLSRSLVGELVEALLELLVPSKQVIQLLVPLLYLGFKFCDFDPLGLDSVGVVSLQTL